MTGLAGLPPAMTSGGMLRATTEPAATTEFGPMVTPGSRMALSPMTQLSRMSMRPYLITFRYRSCLVKTRVPASRVMKATSRAIATSLPNVTR